MQSLLRGASVVAALGLLIGATVPSASAAPAPADLLVVILPPAPLSAAGTIEYIVNVRNIGGSDAHNVVVDDDLPLDAMWQTVTSSQGACAFGPFSPTVDVHCNLGTIGAGNTATINIVVHPFKVSQIDRASASTTDPEASYANNSDTDTLALPAVSVANLEVTLSDRPDPLSVGDVLTYTADIHNIGDDAATDVYIQDYLPPGVRFLDAFTSAGRSCAHFPTPLGEAVFCKLYTINNAGNAWVQIIVQPLNPGVLYNSLSVAESRVDPNQVQDNSATVRTWVNP
jgi:uncharacterized repeat protein (TIGR01451 family)